MGESKHTPGTWEYREIAPFDDGIGYISADGHDIIHAGVSDLPAGENRANARLIAAAPDLLALAVAVAGAADLTGSMGNGPLAKMARSALAKAEGR